MEAVRCKVKGSNHSTKINKTNNHLSPLHTEYKKKKEDHSIYRYTGMLIIQVLNAVCLVEKQKIQII